MEDAIDLLSELSGMKQKPSNTFVQKLLKSLRKSKLRKSDIVAQYGYELIKSGVTGPDVADECIRKLQQKFPKGSRVRRLIGLRYEAAGDFEKALDVYNQLLESNPANLLVLKRRVCIFRAKGDLETATTELHKIVQMFPDISSWIELAELHLSLSDYSAAAHCFEDVILLDPYCPHAHTRLGDCYFTLGGYENFVKARRQYTISLNMQQPDRNLRALYGLLSASRAVEEIAAAGQLTASTANKKEKAVNAELLKWAQEQLRSIGAKTPGGCVALVLQGL